MNFLPSQGKGFSLLNTMPGMNAMHHKEKFRKKIKSCANQSAAFFVKQTGKKDKAARRKKNKEKARHWFAPTLFSYVKTIGLL